MTSLGFVPLIDIGHRLVEVSGFETDVPPRFRLHFFQNQGCTGQISRAGWVTLVTERARRRVADVLLPASGEI